MEKRILFVIFILCMGVTLFPCRASADDYPESGTCGENLTWKLDRTEEGVQLQEGFRTE